jgi:hypothetical protein
MIDQFGRSFALEAENTTVWMIVIGLEADDLFVGHRRNGRAMRRAQGAEAAHRV